MPSKAFSAAITGLDAQLIEIEVDSSFGLPRFNIVGLADKAVAEAKERVESAIKSSGFKAYYQLNRRVLVNLAPADIKKEGSVYDLPIALGYLLDSKQLRFNAQTRIFAGELGLDGHLKPIKGAISFALLAKNLSYPEIVLPQANAREAGIISQQSSLRVIGVHSLGQAIEYLQGVKTILPAKTKLTDFLTAPKYQIDLAWIKGQQFAKRALEIAASGHHNLLMEGPPGTGKTLLAKAFASILPQLSFEESLELSKIYSLMGMLSNENPLINARPFRNPHHASSETALIGGGNPPSPGEITLAHHGVLFLDEFPEFHRDVLESLRQPIEDGNITILRTKHRLDFPAKFMLIAAANPCACGYKNDPTRECFCSNSQIAKYRRKLSGPLMDRIDLFVDVPQVKYEKLVAVNAENSSANVRQKVESARLIQKQRFENEPIFTNSEMNINQIKKHCAVGAACGQLLRKHVNSAKLSARGYHRVLKVSRTIADLDNSENIQQIHLSEALAYRLRSVGYEHEKI